MDVTRIYDAALIAPAIELFLGSNAYQVDPVEWISDPEHIVLMNDKGDMALFEPGIRKYYSGHYFFKSRGREALESAREFLDTIFSPCYNIPVMMGLVPDERRDVKLITRRLGFKSYGLTYSQGKAFEIFILSREEFQNESDLRRQPAVEQLQLH
jgi:hypothetical protein